MGSEKMTKTKIIGIKNAIFFTQKMSENNKKNNKNQRATKTAPIKLFNASWMKITNDRQKNNIKSSL